MWYIMYKILILFLIVPSISVASDSLDRIKKEHVINVSFWSELPPFSFSEKNEAKGMNVDVCKDIIKRMAKKININDIKVNWKDESINNEIRDLKNQTIDLVCSPMVKTTQREELFNFSSPWYTVHITYIYKNDSGFEHIESVKGHTVSITSGDKSVSVISKFSIDNNYVLDIILSPSFNESINTLINNHAVVFLLMIPYYKVPYPLIEL